jgi:hypothetical protein
MTKDGESSQCLQDWQSTGLASKLLLYGGECPIFCSRPNLTVLLI